MTRPGKLPRPVYLTTVEAAAFLRVSKMTVNREIHAGRLKAVRVGKQFRISERALDEYIHFQAVGLGDGWGEE